MNSSKAMDVLLGRESVGLSEAAVTGEAGRTKVAVVDRGGADRTEAALGADRTEAALGADGMTVAVPGIGDRGAAEAAREIATETLVDGP